MNRIILSLTIFLLVMFNSCDLFPSDPDETPPILALQAPEDETTVSGTITISCSASDNDDMDRGELYIDLVASGIIDQILPYTFEWNTVLNLNVSNHTLFVRGWDASGNSADSDTITVFVDNTNVFAPSELLANSFNAEIVLTWTDNSESEEGFIVERNDGSGFVAVDTVSADITTYSDAGLLYGTEYKYRVAAFIGSLNSEYTNIASATIIYFTPEWIEIQAGPFTSGMNDDLVNLNYNYEIMQYEVTNSQYVSFLEEALATNFIFIDGDSIFQTSDNTLFCDMANDENMISWSDSKFLILDGFENYPVILVTWAGAQAFSAHYNWRLPNEQEWEKAARGQSGWDYPWGDNTPTCELANYSGCFDGTIGVGLTTGVSPYGVYDMVGNVWEWTNDLYSGGPERVIKGGSWSYYTENLQVWNSLPVIPEYSYYLIGFRCVRDI